MARIESLKTEQKFKKTEAGEVPVDWGVVSIGDISNICRGASPRPIGDSKYFGNGPGWIRISDVTKANIYLRETEDHLSELGVSKSVCVKQGDLIMSICATIGKPVIVDMDACIHDGFVLFSQLSKQVNPLFLLFWLQENADYFIGQGQHGTQKNLNTGIIKNTRIALPPFHEQKKIAEILLTVDSAIEKRSQLIEKKKELKKGLMQELLSRGIGHEKFYKTKIGEIPEGWEVINLGQVVELQGGFSFKSEDYAESGIPLIRISNLTTNGIKLDECVYLPEEYANDYQEFSLENDDILVAMSGATTGKIGIASERDLPALFNQRVGRFVIKDISRIFKNYLAQVVLTDKFQDALLRDAPGGAQPNVSGKNIEKINIALPLLLEQKRIAEMLSVMDSEIEDEIQEKSKLEQLKKGLMQVLLTGKVRVKI